MSEESSESQQQLTTPPWLFGITNIPYGVSGTFTGVAVPFMLSKAGLSIPEIATVSYFAFLPAAWQLFWAPIVDLGIRRRSWLVLCATSGAILLALTFYINVKKDLLLYEIVLTAGSLFVGLVASCNGALVSTTVDPGKRGQAAGWVNAANLGAAAIGGGLVLTLFNQVSIHAAAITLFLAMFLPSLAALKIKEKEPMKEPLLQHLGNMRKEVWRAVSARRGWTGLLFCLSPVGTVALTQLFSGMGKDYHVSNSTVEWVNGYGGGFVTAVGALASGFILDRADRRKLYLLAGILTAVCGVAMALAPIAPASYIVGVLAYMLVTGLAYASFSAVVYEIVGTAGSTASTLYSVFPAAGNQAIAYTFFADGHLGARLAKLSPGDFAGNPVGVRGVLWVDAAMNLLGVMFLLFMLKIFFKEKGKNSESVPE